MGYSGVIIHGDPPAPTVPRLNYICARIYHYREDGAGDGSEPNLSPVLERYHSYEFDCARQAFAVTARQERIKSII